MGIIEFHHLTKDYGNNKGVFDVTFSVEKGEVFGYLGPNGAGKTTTIRQLLGFLHPDSGEALVYGKNTFKYHYETNPKIGYLPGEIAFPDKMTGNDVLRWNRELKGIKDTKKQDELVSYFELKNLDMKVKRMSKGMKQKIGIICAFVGDPEIIVVDEPTTGLDPLMQHKFINLVLKEKAKGKTIFMSTHIFSEVERTCDKVAIVKNGRIAEMFNVNDILHSKVKEWQITLKNPVNPISNDKYAFSKIDDLNYLIKFDDKDTPDVLKYVETLPIASMSENKGSIEKNFMKLYESGEAK